MNPNNVTLGGATVYFDKAGVWTEVGLTDGDIEINREVQVKELEDKIPLQVMLQVPLREKFSIKIPAVEATAENLSNASLNIPYSTVAGATVHVLDSDNQEKTFAAYPGSPFEAIVLDGGTVSGLVIENQAENTTYTVTADYILDATNGIVYRNPSGAISAGATVRVTYDWVQKAYDQLNFGLNLPVTNKKVKIEHISPVDGRMFRYVFWKVQGQGSLNLSHKKEDWFKVPFDLKALPDADNHPSNPTGYMQILAA